MFRKIKACAYVEICKVLQFTLQDPTGSYLKGKIVALYHCLPVILMQSG